MAQSIARLDILSVNHLAVLLGTPVERLTEVAQFARSYHQPFELVKRQRPFQKKVTSRTRPIDNPRGELKKVQRRIHRILLRPICFPSNVVGAVPKRSVMDNAQLHLNASVLVTIDVKSCFPSITNLHIYRVWREFLGCSTRVAALLTRLTTFDRHLPQGAATSPLLANLTIWMVDGEIRHACDARSVAYSTWIDDLAFSGAAARQLIPISAKTLQSHGLKISRSKVKIMGPREIKLLTGTRLGRWAARAPKDKLSRVRSGIHKLQSGLVNPEEEERFINGLVGQLEYIDRLSRKDSRTLATQLSAVTTHAVPSAQALRFLKKTGK
jgi:RNA-directed DNA polymerase